jgi:hypothetical protein
MALIICVDKRGGKFEKTFEGQVEENVRFGTAESPPLVLIASCQLKHVFHIQLQLLWYVSPYIGVYTCVPHKCIAIPWVMVMVISPVLTAE